MRKIGLGPPLGREARHLGFEPHSHFEEPQHILDLADLVRRDLEGAILRALGNIGARSASRSIRGTARRRARLQG